jgi:cell division protein FtsB
MSERATPSRALRFGLCLLVALFGWLQYRLWLGEGGMQAAAELEGRVAAQIEENRGLEQRNRQLAAEVADLRSGAAAAEERARSELGMIKPGETFYRVVEPAAAAPLDAANASANVDSVTGASAAPSAATDEAP